MPRLSKRLFPNFPPNPCILVTGNFSKNAVTACHGKIVCLFGLFNPQANFAKTLLWATPAEHW